MAVAAELFGRQRIPGPAFGVACWCELQLCACRTKYAL
jgi:hypothetical protein